MATHLAVQQVAKRAPLQATRTPTVQPEEGEVLVKVHWVASTPLDLHQADGGLTEYPNIPCDGISGIVVKLGTGIKNLKMGDRVFGFGWRSQKEKGAQEYATFAENLLGKVPSGTTLQAAVTIPNNFVTVFHAASRNFEISLPWPRLSEDPSTANEPFLIWGASSSVGQYALQILKYYGYRNLLAVASKAHHTELRSLGAKETFDYRERDVVEQILSAAAKISSKAPSIPLIFDCIGSKDGSILPLSKIAQAGAKVAVLLPVVVRDASETVEPIYSRAPEDEAPWAQHVTVTGVRAHFYLENEFLAAHLQPEIMPYMLEKGIVKPNRQRVVEGATLLERAQTALDILRRKEVSGERLVWRVAENVEA